ncbi:MAG: hypothetical protein NUW12_04745 [Firmicutes bacterium]|nr:hypothetical protein [Bacillota bacterium]MDH7495257.1 hypothetical protein [Bacillota bacterium]
MSGVSRLAGTLAGRVCVTVAACVLLALSVGGCGRPKSAGTTLRVAMWGEPEEQRRVEEASRAFEAANAGVRVQLEIAPGTHIAGGVTAYEQKLIVLIAARNAPDVMYLPRERYEFYAEKGALVNLEPFIERNDDSRRLPPGSLEGMRVGGGIYGLARDSGTVLAVSAQTRHPEAAWELLLSIAGADRR